MNRLRIGVVVSFVVCIAMLLVLSQTGGDSAYASPPGPGNCPPPCIRYIDPENGDTCVCPTPLAYGPKGIGDDWHNWEPGKGGTNLSTLDYDWYYDWRSSYLPQREEDPRYVRMVWCTDTTGVAAAAAADRNNGIRGRVWLIYNEPDHSATGTCGDKILPDGTHVYTNPQYMAQHFSGVYDMIKGADPYARVFAGGVVFLDSQRTRNWWQTFINTLKNLDGKGKNVLYKLQGVHVHVYPIVSNSTDPPFANTSCNNVANHYCVPAAAQAANNWYTQMHAGLGLGNLPIWITETGWLHCKESQGGNGNNVWIRNNIMEPMSQWFNKESDWPYDPTVSLNPGYATAAWYATYDNNAYTCTYLLNNLGSGGTPSALGQFWNSYQP